jgi:hypothetical protein
MYVVSQYVSMKECRATHPFVWLRRRLLRLVGVARDLLLLLLFV